MFLLNMDHIPGTDFEVLGLVRGSTVLSKDAASDFVSGLTAFVGGELKLYTQLLDQARDLATERMEAEAEKLGADAVLNIRYNTSEIMQGPPRCWSTARRCDTGEYKIARTEVRAIITYPMARFAPW